MNHGYRIHHYLDQGMVYCLGVSFNSTLKISRDFIFIDSYEFKGALGKWKRAAGVSGSNKTFIMR
jgi:hypothetical protein